MAREQNKWPKQITVDKRIVKILSEQTYENFPNAIRELITNSYDADATRVDVTLNLNKENINIRDNGWGMSEQEFNEYIRIAGQRRERKIKTSSGRYIIGQFGVGFLSVFPFFRNFSIETKKKNSNQVLYASIPCYKYFTDDRIIDIADIDIQGGVKFENSHFNDSYTHITLSGFTQMCKGFFYPINDIKKRKNSVSNMDSISKLIWQLSEDLPIGYEDKRFDDFNSFFSPNLPFKVLINTNPLLRKTYGETILEKSNDVEQIGDIKFKYFVLTNKSSVTPYEARYLKIRNLNVGVGERTNFGLGTEVGGARSRLHWLTGEIHILEGLNGLITVSREGFKFDPDYEKLKEFFIRKLASLSNKLEKEAELESFIKDSNEESRIKNIKLLNPKIVKQKIADIGRKIEKESVPILKNENNISKKPLYEPKPFEKKIHIKGVTYKVVLDRWNINDFYPALKVEDDIIMINNEYPLFKSVKYTDLFIKFHFLLFDNLRKKQISKNNYTSMAKDIFDIFEDYQK
ncbi:hypothetical protein EON78_00940 [bacterium]|nr:MAG: hypothetical protein EON78_00940 [bacterium]